MVQVRSDKKMVQAYNLNHFFCNLSMINTKINST